MVKWEEKNEAPIPFRDCFGTSSLAMTILCVGALTNQCVTVAKDGKNTNILTLDYITIFYIIRRNFAFKTQRLRKI